MPDRIEIARELRQHAEKLRQIASSQPHLSAQLMGIARGIDKEAQEIEASITAP